ncbi:hydrogen peroxide-inducible genes activator [Sphingomonas lenta]|uniref:DNA-binding transcriptional regulator OxyR n=1 Tax=Sphingomonas lenta TaxID=1141887 RepID=A0A2A2SCJ7_9SPHN|nr:hydrogen peroxide-inducible genes activator [Sphingomonas lenta]PAX07024.1 DNA-binding transcriptional regulator OxyR [Sphingomonas lenta]
MPTLRQFRYLVTLADTGSFVAAARNCNVSQPSLSQQIKALEDRLGVKLVERGAAGAILTPIGRTIVGRARGVLAEVRDMEALAARWSDELSGTLRLGTTPTLGPYLLSPIIAELHKAAPELRLYVREGIPDDQALELSRGNLDVLLGPMPVNGDDLEVEPIFREPLYLVGAVDDELAGDGPVEPERLHGRALLSLDKRHHFHRQCAELAAAYGMAMFPDYEGTSLDSLHQMVASGLGLTVLPALYMASDVGGMSGLAVVKVKGWRAHRSVAFAWRRASSMAAAFRLLAGQVQVQARDRLEAIAFS